MQRQVLIVEDNALNREILREILSTQYRVLEAENGQEALDVLQAHGDDVALILLDVMMPVMDGYTFLERIRDDNVLSRIPVIVTTQSDNEEDELVALSHGATDYVPKPYRPRVILHRAASLIKLRETSSMVDQFMFDSLTGLYSREYFFKKVRDVLAEHPETEYTLVCSNIENFKLFNDAYGNAEGDRLLREGADITRKMLGDLGFAGRYAADRFLCLVERGQEMFDREQFGHFNIEISPLMRSVVMRWGIYNIIDRSIPVEQMCDRAMLAAGSIKGAVQPLLRRIRREAARQAAAREGHHRQHGGRAGGRAVHRLPPAQIQPDRRMPRRGGGAGALDSPAVRLHVPRRVHPAV